VSGNMKPAKKEHIVIYLIMSCFYRSNVVFLAVFTKGSGFLLLWSLKVQETLQLAFYLIVRLFLGASKLVGKTWFHPSF